MPCTVYLVWMNIKAAKSRTTWNWWNGFFPFIMYCWCNTTNESAAYPSTTLKCGAKQKPTFFYHIGNTYTRWENKSQKARWLWHNIWMSIPDFTFTDPFSFDLWAENAVSALNQFIQSINRDFFFIDGWLKSIKKFLWKIDYKIQTVRHHVQMRIDTKANFHRKGHSNWLQWTPLCIRTYCVKPVHFPDAASKKSVKINWKPMNDSNESVVKARTIYCFDRSN